MGDNIIRSFQRKKDEKELEKFIEDLNKHLETCDFSMRNVITKNGNILEGYFEFYQELTKPRELSPEAEEMFIFLTQDPPENENELQRRYRLNRIKEHEEIVEDLITGTYDYYAEMPEVMELLEEMKREELAKEEMEKEKMEKERNSTE